MTVPSGSKRGTSTLAQVHAGVAAAQSIGIHSETAFGSSATPVATSRPVTSAEPRATVPGGIVVISSRATSWRGASGGRGDAVGKCQPERDLGDALVMPHGPRRGRATQEPGGVPDDGGDLEVERADRRYDRRGSRGSRPDVGLDGDAETRGVGRQGHDAQRRARLDQRSELVGERLIGQVGSELDAVRRQLGHEGDQAALAVGQAQVERLLYDGSGFVDAVGRQVGRAGLGHGGPWTDVRPAWP